VPSKKPRPSAERKKFGRKVAQLREQIGLTQEDLAEAVGLNARHLQAIEAGDYWPTLPTLKALRKALKTTWESLCESW
jgi:transcriptional regulator with XRE-family HTH domain